MKDLENKIVNRLKELDFNEDHCIGTLTLLDENNREDNYKKMYEFLQNDKLTADSRSDIIEYAFKVSGVKKEHYIIVSE
jgi:hypothetical protein